MQLKQSEELLFINIVLLQNFKIIQPRDKNLQDKGCLLKAKSISKNIRDHFFCVFYQTTQDNQIMFDLNNQKNHSKRKLQQVLFIHGSNMISIVRNIYTNSTLKQSIDSVQSINTVMIIGYFKLTQSISGTEYLPIITIGVFSEYYNFLNLYITSITRVELRYIHDTNNVIKKQSQAITNFQNKWIGLGIVYSKTDSLAKLVYTDTNSKLVSSPIISSATLPSSISVFDLCMSCTIEGGVFGHFDGSVSSVKIISDVQFSNTDTYFLYNEATLINKTPILGSSFKLNTYIPNSEYDVGKGFSCSTGYAFFEGVCIDKTNCKSLTFGTDTYSSFEAGKFYDSTQNKCVNCSSNCLFCQSSLVCTTCRPSYKIVNDKCIRCDDINKCNSSCPANQKFDPMNQLCIKDFNISSQYLFNFLLSSRLFTDNSDVIVIASPPFNQINDQIVHCYIDVDNNPMTLYSFLGGISFTTSTVIKKSFTQIPKGYQKTISFFVLFYGSGNPSNLQLKVNSNIATLDISYQTIAQDKIQCSGSGTQTQSIFKVKYITQDYQNTLDIEIQSTSSNWGIRNIEIQISKCHPTCDSCKAGGSADDCITCSSNLTKNKFQCMCPYGFFAMYSNCFDSTCVSCSFCTISNCLKCEDITGYCTQCASGYTIKDGVCIQNSSCNANDFIYSNYCAVSLDEGFTHFKQDRIVQYADYWKFTSNVFAYPCINRKCTPIIGNGKFYTLSIILPNYYTFHYQLNLVIELFLYQSITSSDNIYLQDGSVTMWAHSLGQQKKNIMGSYNSDYIFTQNTSRFKNDNQLLFKFTSNTDEGISNEGQSFSQVIFSYSRCHPMCKKCNNASSPCQECIDNASIGGGSCLCNSGYYFSLIRFPSSNDLPGKCLKCNSACNTCTGPSPQDCTSCQYGYEIVNNICKYKCSDDQYWDQTSLLCLSCHACCKSCEGSSYNNCHDCFEGYFLRKTDKSCTMYNASCQSCTLVTDHFCGGNQTNHNNCLNSGWVILDEFTCVQCGKYVNGKCAGDYSQNIIDFCNKLGFLYNYDNNNCSSCQILSFGSSIPSAKCGKFEIADRCKSYGWKFLDDNTCIDCNPNSQTAGQCFCDSSCSTCLRFADSLQCETCLSSLKLFNNQCIPNCPNGYTEIGQKCDPCTEEQMPTCVNCYRTCLTCNPFKVSNVPNSCTTCSPLTRKILNGYCLCKDSNDTRETFHECSYQNIAVLNAVLSNSAPLLTINFGKELENQNINPDEYCKQIFTDKTLKLIGPNSKCQISDQKYITVNLVNSDIFDGDLIQFKKNILRFKQTPQTPSFLIDTFLNNMVVQKEIIGQTKVSFDYVSKENSCNDITIKFKNIVNHAERGFKSYQWALKSYIPENQILQQVLEALLQKAYQENRLDLIITKGIIKPNTKVVIRLNFVIKANVTSYEDLNLYVQPEKKIFLGVQSNIIIPFYKYQSAILVITSIIKICDPDGDYLIKEPLNFQISSLQYPDKDYQNSSYEQQEYQIEFQPYTLNSGKIIYNIKAILVSNSFIESQIDFEIKVLPSQLYVKIVGGNGYFNYKNQVTINGKLRDYDIQNETDPQGFDIQWECMDSATEKTCVSQDKIPVIFPSQISTATIEGFTFNPYTVIKLTLIGSKTQNRQATDKITIMFSEIDLPPLGVQIVTSDPQMETINLNEEIFVQLEYNSPVNIDLLSFSGTINYENKVVGIIKFDYTSLRFQIWNYFSDFKINSIQFSIRFNVFNPQYFMPSIFSQILNINFPPNQCQFTITPKIGYSVETKFVLQIQECQDENQPIYYQFFYYQTSDDFEYEKKNPLQVKRRQINDKSQNYLIESLLPSGQILVLAQAIDSKNAIYNTTLKINVQLKVYDGFSYNSLIQQKLDQINKLQASSSISDLSIICDDILKRDELISNSLLNSKKIEILNILNILQKDLSPLSSFSTVADKAIISLSQSGITYSQSQQQSLLVQLMDSLDNSSNLSKLNLELSKEKLKQKLYDSFQVVDTFENPDNNVQSFYKMIELTDKIGDYLFKDILPNEDPIYFQGKQTSIFGTQMTEKYVCTYFLCDGSAPLDSKKQTSIYNLKKSEYRNNPYSQDDTFLDYSNSLKELDPDIQIINYPIITPTISTQQNYKIESFPKLALLSFPITEASLKKNMTCISKKKDQGWTTIGCQNNVQMKQNQYLCACDELSPTTVIDSLEALLLNKNINTALSSDGINNIIHFSNFYKYVAFWFLSIKTIFFIIFYYRGYKSDILDSKQKLDKIKCFNIFEQNYLQPDFSKNQVVPQSLIENDIEENNNLKLIKNDTLQTQTLNNINTTPNQNQKVKRNRSSQNIIFKEEISQNLILSNAVNNKVQILTQKKDTNKTDTQSIPQMTPIMEGISETIQLNEEDAKQSFDLNNQRSSIRKNGIIPPNPNAIKIHPIKESDEKINPSNENCIEDSERNCTNNETFFFKNRKDGTTSNIMSKHQCNFNRLPLYKKIIFFHNFFGIFLLFNPEIPRALRFLIFYVRSIHSLAIAIIYDQNYSILEKIVIAIVNAISVIIVVKILEIVFSCKNMVGKVVGKIFTQVIILGYYYIILSIISGQEPFEANQFILTFVLFFISDVLIVSFFSAIIQYSIANYILKSQKLQGLKRALYQLIQLKYILISLIK